MEPSWKSHKMPDLFLWRYLRWRHSKCGNTQLKAAVINRLHAPVTAFY